MSDFLGFLHEKWRISSAINAKKSLWKKKGFVEFGEMMERQVIFESDRTVGKKGYFFRETLELFNRWSDVGDPFW